MTVFFVLGYLSCDPSCQRDKPAVQHTEQMTKHFYLTFETAVGMNCDYFFILRVCCIFFGFNLHLHDQMKERANITSEGSGGKNKTFNEFFRDLRCT